MTPHDLDAERAAIAAALVDHDPAWTHEILEALTPADFYGPDHAVLWHTIADQWHQGRAVDASSLAALAHITDGPTVIAALIGHHTGRERARAHIARIADLAVLRRVQAIAANALDTIDTEPDPVELIDNLTNTLADVDIPNDTRPITGLHQARDLAAATYDTRPPIIPGFLNRLDRLMVVGLEGTGKSVWLRWIAASAAAGRHPFRGGGTIPQARALIIDAENPEHVITDGLKMFRIVPDNLTILARPGGLDIRKRQDRTLLHRVCETVRPDIICIGPLYKIHRPDPREDDEAAAVRCQQILDDLRVRFDCALILEHHAPKGNQTSRQLVPFGSSAWLRWPEFGWKLIPHNPDTGKDHPDGESLRLGKFRGDRIRIDKPTRFDRGGVSSPWPWESYWADGVPRDEPF